jgi:hypothetical protein
LRDGQDLLACMTLAEKVESFFSAFFAPHFSQAAFSEEFLASFSNSAPHFGQRYS